MRKVMISLAVSALVTVVWWLLDVVWPGDGIWWDDCFNYYVVGAVSAAIWFTGTLIYKWFRDD